LASEDPKMTRKSIVGKKKHLTVTVPQKFGIIRRHESGKSQGEGMASCSIPLSTVYDTKKQKDQLGPVMTMKVQRVF
jgi:hypothetical protein